MLIEISNEINPNLGMNSSAKKLFEKINNSNDESIVIDFSNVVFMSRSFTQEYISQKRSTDKEIIEKNIPVEINKMFDVVMNDFIQ